MRHIVAQFWLILAFLILPFSIRTCNGQDTHAVFIVVLSMSYALYYSVPILTCDWHIVVFSKFSSVLNILSWLFYVACLNEFISPPMLGLVRMFCQLKGLF